MVEEGWVEPRNIEESFQDNIVIKQHAYRKLAERNISLDDMEKAFLSDEIIEQYGDDYPYPSVLLLGFLDEGTPLHLVCAPTDIGLAIITVYQPNEDSWEESLKKRRKKDQV